MTPAVDLGSDVLRTEAAERVRVALTGTVEVFGGAEPDDWPGLVVYLLRILDPLGLDITAVQRQVDDRLAWGDWPTEPGEKTAQNKSTLNKNRANLKR